MNALNVNIWEEIDKEVIDAVKMLKNGKTGDVGSVSGIKRENIKHGHGLLMEWCVICLMFEWRLHLYITSGRITLFSPLKVKKRNVRSVIGLVKCVWGSKIICCRGWKCDTGDVKSAISTR